MQSECLELSGRLDAAKERTAREEQLCAEMDDMLSMLLTQHPVAAGAQEPPATLRPAASPSKAAALHGSLQRFFRG